MSNSSKTFTSNDEDNDQERQDYIDDLQVIVPSAKPRSNSERIFQMKSANNEGFGLESG